MSNQRQTPGSLLYLEVKQQLAEIRQQQLSPLQNLGYDTLKFKLRSSVLSTPLIKEQSLQRILKAKLKLRGFLMWTKVKSDMINLGTKTRLLNSSLVYRRNIGSLIMHKTMNINELSPPSQSLKCLLHPDSKFKQIWNMATLFLLFYVFIGTPLIIAFQQVETGSALFICETLIDGFFFCDIIITLNSAYFESDVLVTSRYRIFTNYLTGMLLFDIIAVFPFWVITAGNDQTALVRIIRITKVSRVFRASKLLKVVKYLKDSDSVVIEMIRSNEGVARLATIAFVIVIMAHFSACMWFFFAKLDGFGPDTWVVRHGFVDRSKGHLYLASLYWAFTILTTVGFGDIHAFSDSEMVVCIVWMLFGIGFYSFLVGTLTSVLSAIDKRNQIKQERLTEVENFGEECKVSNEVLSKMKAYVSGDSDRHSMPKSQRFALLSQLSLVLRVEVCMSMYRSAPDRVLFFKTQGAAFLTYVIPRLDFMRLRGVVYKKWDHPDFMYFVVSGRVDYVVGDEFTAFKSMLQGGYFGEIELFERCQRYFTVICNTCEALSMSSVVFHEMLEAFPRAAEQLKALYVVRKARNLASMHQMLDFLEAVDIKREFTAEQLAGKSVKEFTKGRYEEYRLSPATSIKKELAGVLNTIDDLARRIEARMHETMPEGLFDLLDNPEDFKEAV